jgi:hypothetical protein
MEAGKSLGRELAFCTAHQDESAFFLGADDMESPDGDKDLAARCEHCHVEGSEEAETHWVTDFKTAVFEGMVQTQEGGFILDSASLLKNLIEAHGSGPVAKAAAARRAVS